MVRFKLKSRYIESFDVGRNTFCFVWEIPNKGHIEPRILQMVNNEIFYENSRVYPFVFYFHESGDKKFKMEQLKCFEIPTFYGIGRSWNKNKIRFFIENVTHLKQ